MVSKRFVIICFSASVAISLSILFQALTRQDNVLAIELSKATIEAEIAKAFPIQGSYQGSELSAQHPVVVLNDFDDLVQLRVPVSIRLPAGDNAQQSAPRELEGLVVLSSSVRYDAGKRAIFLHRLKPSKAELSELTAELSTATAELIAEILARRLAEFPLIHVGSDQLDRFSHPLQIVGVDGYDEQLVISLKGLRKPHG